MSRKSITDFYFHEMEKDRLELEAFKLEGIRTKLIIERYLTGEKLNILDIGGGAGYYAFWLQQKGHHVTLIDLSPKNIELVNEYSARNHVQLECVEMGDAISLPCRDNEFDLVLLLGPLYHLTEKKDRIKAISEARRVLKPGGMILAAVISRYASLFDGFKRDLVNDAHFEMLLKDDLKTGIHLNATNNLEYFTTAYFHTPGEIKEEMTEAGFIFEKLIGIESFGWIVDDFMKKSNDEVYMKKLLYFIEQVESDPGIIAMSPHIITVGKKE